MGGDIHTALTESMHRVSIWLRSGCSHARERFVGQTEQRHGIEVEGAPVDHPDIQFGHPSPRDFLLNYPSFCTAINSLRHSTHVAVSNPMAAPIDSSSLKR